MPSGFCDFCSNADEQLVRTPTGYLMCPECATPMAPSDACDRCGEPVNYGDGDVILYAPPSFHDIVLGFRHGACGGIFDCSFCGEPIDVKVESYGRSMRNFESLEVTSEIWHTSCQPYPEG